MPALSPAVARRATDALKLPRRQVVHLHAALERLLLDEHTWDLLTLDQIAALADLRDACTAREPAAQ